MAVAFAAGRGRAVLADDMGLGKTIQGVGVAELLARQAGIERVLIVCPASLKSQWRAEIERFCDRSVQLVSGKASERATGVRRRRVLHRVQLRAGAARLPRHRARRSGTSSSSTRRSASRTGRRRPAASSRPCARRSPWCSPARRWRTGSTICTRSSSSSTTAGSAPRTASSTGIAWRARPAECWATRTSTRCASI